MIQSTINISLSGPAHSVLLMETARCQFGQEGFLLGRYCDHTIKCITDDNEKEINTSRIIKIIGALPCPLFGYFYNGTGIIDVNKIRSILGSQINKVVGWYRYSPATIPRPTFRERIIHGQLAEFFKIPLDLFIVCILNRTPDVEGVKYNSESFSRILNSRLEPIPLKIPNLQNKDEGYEMNLFPSPTFQALVHGASFSQRNSNGMAVITNLNESVQEHWKQLNENVSKEDQKLFSLEQEIKKLTALKRKKEIQKIPDEYDFNHELDDVLAPFQILPFEFRKEVLEKTTLKKM